MIYVHVYIMRQRVYGLPMKSKIQKDRFQKQINVGQLHIKFKLAIVQLQYQCDRNWPSSFG
jgi:hypothetical protein